MYQTLGHIFALLLYCSVLIPAADHLLLSMIVTKPNDAEMISIYNPTDSQIDLSNYFISDANQYYKIQTEGDLIPGSSILGFIAKFPNAATIDSKQTINIALSSDYGQFYEDLISPDYYFGDGLLQETDTGSFGSGSDKLGTNDCIILFYWNGEESEPVKDIDYFIWGDNDKAIDKTDIQGYNNDTPIAEQDYFLSYHSDYFAYMRVDNSEGEENLTEGNGISGHDETSEPFNSTWDIIGIPEFTFGCMDNSSENYDVDADAPCNNYGTENDCCIVSFEDEVSFNDLISDYAAAWNYQNQVVTVSGMLVDYFDITVYGGPHALTLEDENGLRVECTMYPEVISEAIGGYSDYFENIIAPPYERHFLQVTSTVGDYNGELQLGVSTAGNLRLLETFDSSGTYLSDSDVLGSCYSKTAEFVDVSENECSTLGHNWILSNQARILPAPFPLIPALGETLDFSYFFPNNSRVIIRVYDISGRFITSLVDQYYSDSGVVIRGNDVFSYMNSSNNSSAWDGRDIHGQILSAGTYIMSIEAYNFTTGEMSKDAAPVVIGVYSNE